MKGTNELKALDVVGYGTDGILTLASFQQAISAGYRTFDTADSYRNMETLAKAISESGLSRDDFYINYKIKPNEPEELFRAKIDDAIEQFGYLDCCMLHDMAADKTTLFARLDFIAWRMNNEDCIRSMGLSNVSSGSLRSLLDRYPKIQLIQNQFSHVQQDDEVRAICHQNQLNYLGYSVFGGRPEGGECEVRFDCYEMGWNVSEIAFPGLSELSRRLDLSPHELVLCWAIQQGTHQIPSSTNSVRMKKNLDCYQRALSMSKADQAALEACFSLKVSQNQWQRIEQASQSYDRLAILQSIAGAFQLPRHRLLEAVYLDDQLKGLFDFILDQGLVGDIELSSGQELVIRERALYLCHFLEDCLRRGGDLFQFVVTQLHTITQLCQAQEHEDYLADLIGKLCGRSELKSKLIFIERLHRERTYFETNGYFKIKMLDLPFRHGITVLLMGPNRILYLLKNVSEEVSIYDIAELLREQYPSDFADPAVLDTIYYSGDSETLDVTSDEAKTLSLEHLGYSPGVEIFGLAGSPDCEKLLDFYHSFDSHPEAYSGPFTREVLRIGQAGTSQSLVCDMISARSELASLQEEMEDVDELDADEKDTDLQPEIQAIEAHYQASLRAYRTMLARAQHQESNDDFPETLIPQNRPGKK